jgi:phage I-like protein
MFRGAPISIRLDEITSGSTNPNIIPRQVQLLRTGKFYSQEYGELNITKEILLSMKKNFDDRVRGIDLAVDYKHDSEDVAAGWFKDIYTRNDDNELWADIDWTKNGEMVLSSKEFRYISAEFDFNYEGNEGSVKFGPTLFGAGLTNRPFIKDMKPVIDLSEKSLTKGKAMDEKDKKIAELEAIVESLKKQITDLEHEKKTPLPVSESHQTNPESGPVTNVDALKSELEEMKKQILVYQEKEKKFEEEKKLAEKTNSFNKLLSEGKAVEAQRAAFMSGDTVKFAENARPINLGGMGSSHDAPGGDGKKTDAQAEILRLAKVALSEKKVKDLGEGIKKVLIENADLRQQYEAI